MYVYNILLAFPIMYIIYHLSARYIYTTVFVKANNTENPILFIYIILYICYAHVLHSIGVVQFELRVYDRCNRRDNNNIKCVYATCGCLRIYVYRNSTDKMHLARCAVGIRKVDDTDTGDDNVY